MRSPYHFSAVAHETVEKILQARDVDVFLWPLGSKYIMKHNPFLILHLPFPRKKKELLSILDLIDLSYDSGDDEEEEHISVPEEIREVIFQSTRSEDVFDKFWASTKASDDAQDGTEDDSLVGVSEEDLLGKSNLSLNYISTLYLLCCCFYCFRRICHGDIFHTGSSFECSAIQARSDCIVSLSQV